MEDRHEYCKNITNSAIELHSAERQLTLRSVRLVEELRKIEPWYFLGMSISKYAYYIGLTPSTFYKRLQVAQTIKSYPKVLELYENGETSISHIAAISHRLTPENQDILIEAIRNKSKREVEDFICRVTADGQITERPDLYETVFRLTREQRQMLDRAREIMSHAGHVPRNVELFEEAFKLFLKQKDPMQKAERAASRAAKREEKDAPKEDAKDAVPVSVETEEGSLGKAEEDENASPKAWGEYKRKSIPRAHLHAIWLRDGAQCTFVDASDERCPERIMLEVDHIKMVCRGGGNEVENLRLRCRYHNQSEAHRSLSGSV